MSRKCGRALKLLPRVRAPASRPKVEVLPPLAACHSHHTARMVSLHCRGAVGSIEEVALGPAADSVMRRGWHLLACHSAPEFPEATAKDAITLGVLLGAGSFGKGCSNWLLGYSAWEVEPPVSQA